MRHDRSTEFEAAIAHADSSSAARRWTDVASDPNDPLALARRAEVLRAAWRPPVEDRLAFFEARCRDRNVLDVGCVAHDSSRMSSPAWLHGRIAAVAARCLGVDIIDDGVQAMRAAGFDAVTHDLTQNLTQGLGPLATRAPFDVIVAGELFEHVTSLDMLFALAFSALTPDGELLITTPNPYAPARVRAGQRGVVHENVDHVVYAFPSGVAELCERHGLRLAEAMTSATRRRRLRGVVKSTYRSLRGTRWSDAGFATHPRLAHVRVTASPLDRLRHLFGRQRRQFVGETFFYVVRR